MLTTTNSVAAVAVIPQIQHPFNMWAFIGWVVLFCAPYIAVIFFRRQTVDFFATRKFHRLMISGIAVALYPLVIGILTASNNFSDYVIALIISYVAFIGTSSYIDFSVENKIEELLADKESKIKDLTVKLGKLGNDKELLLKFNKFEKYIEEVIGKKAERFLASYQKFKKGGTEFTGHDIFNTITRPDIQLKELYAITKRIFEDLFCATDETLQYSIMELHGQQLQFTAHSTRPRSLDSEEYKSGKAFTKGSGYTASNAWESGDMIIIEDMAAELKKPRPKRLYQTNGAHDSAVEEGSLISYPIFDKDSQEDFEDGLICVLNITAKKSKTFVENEREYYKIILDKISHRIILEKRLELLKSLLKKGATV